MDDSLEWMTMHGDCLLSQVTASAEQNTTLLGPLTKSSAGGAIVVPATSKPRAVFVDADLSANEAPLTSSYEQQQFYNDANVTCYDDCLQQLYFDTSAKGTSPSSTASFASFDDSSQVFAEFFTTPFEKVTMASEAQTDAYIMEADTMPLASEEWVATGSAADPNLGAILNEIRSEAAEIDQRSREGSQFSGTPPPLAYSSDDEFEAALNGHSIDTYMSISQEADSMPIGQEANSMDKSDDDYQPEEPIVRPKRKYTKRLGRPLTKEERRDRKKAQNRAAAIRYRQKRMDNQSNTEHTLVQLMKRNHSLRYSIKTTQAEIDIMKKLLNDVRFAGNPQAL